jgi:large subunit ribosomal protein L10
MPNEAKRETVAELQDELSRSRTLVVSEYRGLTVKEIGEIRRTLRRQDVSYRVVKNRLMRIAAEGSIGDALAPLLTGPTAIAFGQDEVATARAVIEATRSYRIVKITGAVLGGQAIDADAVTRLATLPPREALLAQTIGAVVAPLATTAGLLQASLRDAASLLQALIDRRAAEGGEAAARPA